MRAMRRPWWAVSGLIGLAIEVALPAGGAGASLVKNDAARQTRACA